MVGHCGVLHFGFSKSAYLWARHARFSETTTAIDIGRRRALHNVPHGRDFLLSHCIALAGSSFHSVSFFGLNIRIPHTHISFYFRWTLDGGGERMGGQSRRMLDVIAHYQTHYSSTYVTSHQTMWEEKTEVDFLIWVLYINVCITICSMTHNLRVDTTRTSTIWHEDGKTLQLDSPSSIAVVCRTVPRSCGALLAPVRQTKMVS
jgi:hypothetical protein